ncbi:nitrite reductase [mine drainage metagenome]|uniref:Nitrite reductase n=1 Tax=mine drainage metagenome TaxID=410659 RepID=A0A1J5Q488_9ZZZZ
MNRVIPIAVDSPAAHPSAGNDSVPHSAAQSLPHYMRAGTLQLAALPPLSLYVHLPWCLKKCPYCDFNSHEWRTGGAIPERAYLAALRADLDAALPLIWEDLGKAGMVSGHAYGKSIRTVKTCVGAEHCRFGTQLSMTMGVKLEKMLFGMWAPHKVKLAVSGCPRNCAEAGIKDVGVIGLDSGYELYVAGNGGIKTDVAQFFCKVETDDEVMEYSGAFLQLYREEGYYLERTVHYVNRVGLDYVKTRVVEDASNRKALFERLLYALQGYEDPWLERVRDDRKRREFRLIPVEALA